MKIVNTKKSEQKGIISFYKFYSLYKAISRPTDVTFFQIHDCLQFFALFVCIYFMLYAFVFHAMPHYMDIVR